MIRIARPEDAEAVASLLVRSIREVCGPDYGNDEDVLSAWCANKTPENMRRGISSADNFWIVAEQDGKLAGTALMSNEGEIMLCYLMPEYLGKGLGKSMLDDLLQRAKGMGLHQVTLESTITARDFYRRNGFVELGETLCFGKVPGYKMERAITN